MVDVGVNRITERDEIERLFPGDEKRLAQWARRGSTLVGDVDGDGDIDPAWAAILNDLDNNACDASDNTDRDHRVQSTGRNLIRAAYTYAPAVVTAFLAATATKVAVYALLRFLFGVFGYEFALREMPFDVLTPPNE